MSGDGKWYVVHTFSGYENKVAGNILTVVENHNLQHLIQEVCVPTEQLTEIKDNKTKVTERKIYPGYVFIKMVMDDEAWYVVRNTRGCTGFVGPESKPVPLSDEEVARLNVETNIVEVNYKVGDMVKVTEGPLESFSGIVESIDIDNNTVRVTISMFGRETPVDLELDQLELIND